jgi:hypothetical protein
MRLDSSGNLGIGTSSPGYKLDVERSGDGITAGIAGGTYGIRFDNGGTFSSGMSTIHGVDSTLTATYQPIMLNGATVRFGISGTEVARFDTSGNLGIGTSSPAYPLQVRRPGGACSLGLTMDNYGSIAELARSIFYYAIGDSTSDQTGHLFFTRNATSTDNLRLVINSAGNVGIGTGAPNYKLVVSNSGAEGFEFAPGFTTGLSLLQTYNRTTSAYDSLRFDSADYRFTTGGTERARITSGGALLVGGTSTINSSKILAAGNSYGWVGTGSGVDGTYIDWFALAPYSPDTNEQHRIRASTSSVASLSGIQFMISNGGGSSAQTESFRINRASCTVIGALSKGSGSFKIDHPLKPDTHHLVHSFIEGPQADLIYRGKATLVNGKATINIDSAAGMTEGTFVSLCRDVQCFTSNESDWDAVRGLVDENLLTIESQNTSSSAAVSWLVIGERQDKHMYETEWTDENGKVIVEPVKS